jgi:hypothetical protein
MKALAAIIVALAVAQPATAKPAHVPRAPLEHRVRTAPVDAKWGPVLWTYTGGYYSTAHVNQLWPKAPKGPRRGIILEACIRHRVPWRLLLGVWGAESTWGRAASHFGLTGYFPGRGTSGSFSRDADLAAALFNRLYRARHGRSAL